MKFPPALGGRIRNGIWEAGLLLVLPLAFHRGFAEQFSTPKFFLTKCLIITGLAVWALGGVWTPALRRVRFPLGLPLLAFSLAALISCLASPVPRFSLLEVEFALCGPAWVLLLASWDQGESAVRRIAVLTGLAGGLVAGITLLQRFGFDPVLLGGYQVDWGSMVARMRLYSTFGNPNFVGGYLIGTIFAALALAAASKARWAKALWLGFTLIMLAAIVATGSRGAWLGLAVGLVAAAMIVLPRNNSRPQEVRVSSRKHEDVRRSRRVLADGDPDTLPGGARRGATLRQGLFVALQLADLLAAPDGGFRLGGLSTLVSGSPGEIPLRSSRVCWLLDQQPPSA